MKNFSYDRYIFHDIDYYPDKELYNLYFKFINYNIHLVPSKLNNFISGVLAIKKEDFEKINGFPNNFFGQGTENDAFYNRCVKSNLDIYQPSKGSFLDNPQNNFKIDKGNKYFDNIAYDKKNSFSNGLKQLLNFFINIKKYEYNYFIETYSKIDRNYSNNSDSIQTFIDKYNINYVPSKKNEALTGALLGIELVFIITQTNLTSKISVLSKRFSSYNAYIVKKMFNL